MNRPAMIECLESRRHLSVTLTDGLLTVTGTRRSDHFDIFVTHRAATDGLVVVVNHETFLYFDPRKVRGIDVELGAGNDTMSFPDINGGPGRPFPRAADIPVTVRGGGGDDTLSGSSRSDLLDGGEGDDRLSSQGGDDTVLGGAGNDFVYAGDGDDLVSGGAGADELFGYGGNDTLSGDGGHDILYGGRGGDLLTGGANADTLDGEEGYDRVFGSGGNNWFIDYGDSTRERRDFGSGDRLVPPPHALSIRSTDGFVDVMA